MPLHQYLQAEHCIKYLSNILTKYLTNIGEMWQRFLFLAKMYLIHYVYCYKFNTPNLANMCIYKLVFLLKSNEGCHWL